MFSFAFILLCLKKRAAICTNVFQRGVVFRVSQFRVSRFRVALEKENKENEISISQHKHGV